MTRCSPSPLLAIAPGPTRILRSNGNFPWHGFLCERHFTSPGERLSARSDRHVISIVIDESARFEYQTVTGGFAACVSRPGTIMVTPAGPVPDMHLHTPAEFIHCAFEEDIIHRLKEELDHRPVARPAFRCGIYDRTMQRLLRLLAEELENGKPLGNLYVDSLAHALATRYLSLDPCTEARPEPQVSGLPTRLLNRVREKMESHLDADLSLDDLAEASGYSRAHFLRMFRAATGLTPHQYILDLRLRRAQDCLRKKSVSIIDIAALCGFSSQSHMTSAFRQRLEMTPGEFRRNA